MRMTSMYGSRHCQSGNEWVSLRHVGLDPASSLFMDSATAPRRARFSPEWQPLACSIA